MKKSCCIILVLLCYVCPKAQLVERIAVKGGDLIDFYNKEEYKYPKFLGCHVYLKNGDSAVGKFNFDFFDQSMRYINEKRDTVAIANEKDVAYVAAGTDTFFYDNGFYEWMATSAVGRLAVKHTYKLLEHQNIGAYGISSPTLGVKSIGRVFGTGASTELPPNEEIIFKKETAYYISPFKKGNSTPEFILINKNNMSDLFPKKDVEGFIKDNKLNLNKEEDLIDLFIFVSKPK